MRIITKAKNLELSKDLQSAIDKKIGSLKKFLNILKKDTPNGEKTLAEVFVEIGKETFHHRKGNIFFAKAQIYLPGKKLAAQAKGDTPLKTLTAIKDELKKEVKKYKLKKIDQTRRKQRRLKKKLR